MAIGAISPIPSPSPTDRSAAPKAGSTNRRTLRPDALAAVSSEWRLMAARLNTVANSTAAGRIRNNRSGIPKICASAMSRIGTPRER